MACAFVGLGSNLDGPVDQVRTATRLLNGLPGTHVERCSGLYRTAPMGMREQPDFINAVCQLSTSLAPAVLMRHLLAIEAGRGRVRFVSGGPRILDLDLLLYIGADGRQELSGSADLVLPHPRLHERAFVLYPLHEIAPTLEIVGLGTVSDLREQSSGQIIERLADMTAGQEDAASYEQAQ